MAIGLESAGEPTLATIKLIGATTKFRGIESSEKSISIAGLTSELTGPRRLCALLLIAMLRVT
jgi:hypothetical protein